MPPDYFTRVRGRIQQGIWRLISSKEICSLDHLNVPTELGKFSVNHFKQFHSPRSGTFMDLHSFVRPGTVAAAQASLHISNQRNNLSVVRVLSRAISLPSISGPSFQACGYHIECLLSEPSEVLDGKKQKAHMAISGSSPLISRLGLPGFPAYMPIRSYSKVRIQCGGKITMSLINKEQLNNFLLYGYFMYNVARRRDCGKSFWGFLFENFHISSPAFSIASPAHHDVSIGNNMKEEKQSISTDSPESSSPFNRCLKLNSGSCYLPHPEKEETGGEDAHFICADEHAIGVADGVGGWADLGVNAGLYARELMSNSVNAIQEEPKGSVDPARVLEKAYIKTRARGSSTACIIALTDQGLHAINLGDSGFMVVRDGCTVFRSPVQQHDFNFTYQLESGNSGDLPSSGQVFTIPVAPGDVVIAGTDGLFDNLYNSDITAVVVHAQRAGFSPQVTAQKIVALARQRAQDKDRQTPFSTAAQEAGFRYYGGKLDDITVLVSYITSEHTEKENSSAKSS